MDCKSGRDSGIYISATVALMDIPNCRIVCRVERIKMPKRGVNWASLKILATNKLQFNPLCLV